jgi:hypothetical protein
MMSAGRKEKRCHKGFAHGYTINDLDCMTLEKNSCRKFMPQLDVLVSKVNY